MKSFLLTFAPKGPSRLRANPYHRLLVSAGGQVLLLSLWLLLPIARLNAQDPAAHPRLQTELIDILDAARLGLTKLYPLDCVVQINSTKSFDEDVEVAPTQQFRLLLDPAREKAIWVDDGQVGFSPIGETAPKTGQRPVRGVRIEGRLATPFPRGGNSPQRFSSFNQALSQSFIPSPDLWGLVHFPGGGSLHRALDVIHRRIQKSDSELKIVRAADERIVCSLKNHQNADIFQIYKWTFELPDFRPVSFDVDQTVKGNLSHSVQKDIIWSDGPDSRPVMITTQTPCYRPAAPGVGYDYDVGQLVQDVDIAYLPVHQPAGNDGASFIDQVEIIRTEVDALKFIDDGRKQATSIR